MHSKQLVISGPAVGEAGNVLVMLHGRGATAEDILTLAPQLYVPDFTVIAPQATGRSWYPYSFLAPVQHNQPWLDAALDLLGELVTDITAKKIERSHIYLLGFSQGACLMLEFTARNAARYGGLAAFTGGLIGERPDRGKYSGTFDNTPVFLGSGNPDPHVPVERVYATANILRDLGADVTEKLYDHMGHTIIQDEINIVNREIFGLAAPPGNPA